jgi:hypothetical protein
LNNCNLNDYSIKKKILTLTLILVFPGEISIYSKNKSRLEKLHLQKYSCMDNKTKLKIFDYYCENSKIDHMKADHKRVHETHLQMNLM